MTRLIEEWFALLAYCNDRANFDQKEFKSRSDLLVLKYRRLTVEQQGEFTHEIHKGLTREL